MTNKQQKTIERIRKQAERSFFYGSGEKYEFKEFEVRELEGVNIVSVFVEVGMKNDEGTMARYLCRDRFNCYVGPRGGVTYYPFKGNSLRRWDGRSLHEIALAQKA